MKSENPKKANLSLKNLPPDEVEQLLDDCAWEDGVVEAASFIAQQYSSKLNKDPYDLMNSIIEYNLTKKLHSAILHNSEPLPAQFNWKEMPSNEAFYEFEDFVARAYLLKTVEKFKPMKMKVLLSQNNIKSISKLLPVWKKNLEETYPEIKININEKKESYIISLV